MAKGDAMARMPGMPSGGGPMGPVGPKSTGGFFGGVKRGLGQIGGTLKQGIKNPKSMFNPTNVARLATPAGLNSPQFNRGIPRNPFGGNAPPPNMPPQAAPMQSLGQNLGQTFGQDQVFQPQGGGDFGGGMIAQDGGAGMMAPSQGGMDSIRRKMGGNTGFTGGGFGGYGGYGQ